MHPLHRLVFPGVGQRDDDLYLLATGGATVRAAGGVITLAPGQGLTADTYFGVLPLQQWTRSAAIQSWFIALTGQGRAQLRLKTLEADRDADTTLFEAEIDLADGVREITSAFQHATAEGIYLELVALSPVQLGSAAFLTADTPRRRVDLGLVVTTFGRPVAIAETMEKLGRFIAADPESALGSFALAVIDNGRELGNAQVPGVTVIPNQNLGGAGGFARGLSHFLDGGTATHACFMDDDAATEDECLLRTRRLLAFAIDERTAVSAAMLRAEVSFMMHEQGALFEWGANHRIISRKNGLDVRRREHLHRVLQPEPFGYGGWWFFAFPIRGALTFPYPMFVRGDDWLFSYLNDFAIQTMVGIASWQEGFEGKISPNEQYLATKAFLVAEIIIRKPPNRLQTAQFFARWVARNIFGYCYDRAELNLQAISDVLKGPQFWDDNAALGKRLGQLRLLVTAEKLEPLGPGDGGELVRASRPERRSKALLRVLTLNGHLLPSFIGSAETALTLPRIDAPQPRFTFGRPVVRYVDEHQRKVFVAAKDTARALSLLGRLAILLVRLVVGYNRLRRDYLTSIDRFGTQGWWKETFNRPE